MANESRNYRVVSLFSGCGGMDLGTEGGFTFLGTEYESLPMEIIASYDNDPFTKIIYDDNFRVKQTTADIRHVEADDVPECDIIRP